MEDDVLQDGEAQLMMGRMVPLLQVNLTWKHISIYLICLLHFFTGFGQFCWQNI